MRIRELGAFSRVAFAAIFPALALYAILARRPLVSEGMWRDEAAAIYVARAPGPREFLSRQMLTEYTPPLFNAIVSAYGRLVGFREAPLQWFAVGLALLSLGAIAFLAFELFGAFAAAAAAVLAFSNPVLIRLFAELRVYSLSVVFAALAVLLANRIVRAGAAARYGQAAGLAAIFSLLAYSHMAGVLVVASIAAYGLSLFVSRASRRAGAFLFGAAVCAGILFAPWVHIAWSQYRAGVPYQKALVMADRWKLLALRMVDIVPVFGGRVAEVGLAVAFAASAAALIVFRKKVRANLAGMALTATAGSAVVLFMGLLTGSNRYLAIPAALAAVCAAGLLDAMPRLLPDGPKRSLVRAAVAAFLVGYFAAGVGTVQELTRAISRDGAKSGIRTMCRQGVGRGGDLVLVAPDYLASTLWYYCGNAPALRGAALGADALKLDWRTYSRAWLSPSLVRDAVARVRAEAPAHFFFVMDAGRFGPPMNYSAVERELRSALGAVYGERSVSQWKGRMESVILVEFSRRPDSP